MSAADKILLHRAFPARVPTPRRTPRLRSSASALGHSTTLESIPSDCMLIFWRGA